MKRYPPRKTISNPRLRQATARKSTRKGPEGRKRKASLFMVLLLLSALSTTVGVLFGFQKLQTWDALHVQQIEMDGLDKVRPDEVRLYIGHVLGRPILAVHGDELEKVLLSHPWVKHAKIERKFPDTLKVRIVEHEAKAILSATKLYLLDAQGVPFKSLEAEDDLDLPLITGIDDVIIKEDRNALREKILLAFKAQSAFEKIDNQVLGFLNEIQIEPVVGVSLRTSKGIHAMLGDKSFDAKAEKLKEIVEYLPEQDRFSTTFLLTGDKVSDRVTVRMNPKQTTTKQQKSQ
ncbi:MAG: hypothetical protein CMH56_09400 [Myxococcales bacterium]|nr:hypothetical protein [Myxococcales bacterium]|tara:strand:+ start:661 stop:1530 length:870 start_codon:yes stop_codon:yes gene_type:complete